MNKTYAVEITEQSQMQLKEIRDYIAYTLKAPDTAKKWLQTVLESVQSLGFEPARIKKTEEEPWRSKGIRRLIVKNHYVYFWIDEENVKVYVIGIVYQKWD